MDKKIRNFYIAGFIAFITAIVIIVSIILVLFKVNEIWNLVGSGSISFNNTQDINGLEAPSILSDSDVSFQGDGTLSLEDGTIGMNASVTPLEFKEGTKARIKINGENYKLKRKDNAFIGNFRVSAFENIKAAELILEDGDTVRTEELICEQASFLSSDIHWGFDGTTPTFSKNKYAFDTQMILSSSSEEETPFSSAQIIGAIDGKNVYKKEFKLGKLSAESSDVAFDWKDEIKVPEGKVLCIYLETKDKYGFVYRYSFGQVSQQDQGVTFEDTEKQKLEVLNPKGKTIFQKNVNEVEEE